VSRQLRPDLPAETRRDQIEALLAPVRPPEVEPSVKAAVIARLFQVLLIGSLAGWHRFSVASGLIPQVA